jgi:hypothetical protein
VDYLIGTCACRLPGQAEHGRNVLARILHSYRLDAEGRRSVQEEARLRCPPSSPALVPVDLTLVREAPTVTSSRAVSTVRGKTLHTPGDPNVTVDAQTENIVQIADTSVIRRLSQVELEGRLFPPARAGEAVRAVGRLAGPGFRVVHHGQFVIASSTHTPAQLDAVGVALTTYLDFYLATFQMQRPAHLVTVYLAADAPQIGLLAARIHGLRLSPLSIGYSFPEDLSMVAIIPGQVYGTLMHELFHLVARTDFGDLPAWLDEGMAALYEVSGFDAKGTVHGLPNWRGPVLQSGMALRPSVEALVRADWPTFDALAEGVDQQAVNHATARYFALYLQQQGLLARVYATFRAQDLSDLGPSPGDDAVRLLQRATGRSAAALEADFRSWLPGNLL